MIPTTLTANTPQVTAASMLNGNNGAGNPCQQIVLNTATKELVIGIASLVIEGRAFADDEFHMLGMRPGMSSPPRGGGGGGGSTNASLDLYETPNTSSGLASSSSLLTGTASNSSAMLLHNLGGASGSNFVAGRQSPKPSTSKAAIGHINSNSNHSIGNNSNCNNMPHLINITTNPHHAFGAITAPLFIETPNSYHSSSSAASSAESTHQRWTQKLCQLRQASPAASLTAPYEQKIAIEAAQSSSTEPELVALAIHDPSTAAERGAAGGDFDIVRRYRLNRAAAMSTAAPTAGMAMSMGGVGGGGGSSAASSPSSASSDNFLHSLQSLATTCLRGNSPSLESPASYHYNAANGGGSYSKYAAYRATMATASASATTTTPPRFQNPYAISELHSSGSANSGGSAVQSPKLGNIACTQKLAAKATTSGGSSTHLHDLANSSAPKVKPPTNAAMNALASKNPSKSPMSTPKSTPTSTATSTSILASASSLPSSSSKSNSNTNSHPQQGPHCDQFLKKMGLAKGEAAEAEDHFCDMSYVNITCSRWRAYCLKIEALIERGEPICIEVFLGPVNHKLLLEQWIITYKEKVPPPTMTLPSLCSAIRSQLYFSQISAWCDLIRKSDKSTYETGRVVFGGNWGGMMGCAGDLATTTAATNLSCTPPNTGNNVSNSINSSSSSSNSHTNSAASGINTTNSLNSTTSPLDQLTNAMLNRRPRLNVFYRVKMYNATACFNSKPIIHNFPNVNISENCSISICLKSLPRITGGIPKVMATMSTPNENTATATAAAGAAVATTTTAPTSANVGCANAVLVKSSNDETPRSSRNLCKVPPATNVAGTVANATATTSASASTSGTAVAVAALNSNCDKYKMKNFSSDSSSCSGGSISSSISSGNGNGNYRCSGNTNVNSLANNFNHYKNSCHQQQQKQQQANNNCSTTPHSIKILSKSSTEAIAGTGAGATASTATTIGVVEPPTCSQVNPVKCKFFIDEAELNLLGNDIGDGSTGDGDLIDDVDVDVDVDADADIDPDADGDIDADADADADDIEEPNCSNGSCGSLSHREKQLLKYRKRMLKRDMKHLQRNPFDEHQHLHQQQHQCHQPMEQGDDEDVSESSSEQTVTTMATVRHQSQHQQQHQHQQQSQHSNYNYNENHSPQQQHQQQQIQMISTGTQTPATGCCQHCGSEKSLVCLKCSPSLCGSAEEEMRGEDEMDACSVNSLSSIEIISTPRSKADLLLQAIQRTPKAAKHKKQTARNVAGFLNTTSSAPTLNNIHRGRHAAPPLNNNHLGTVGGGGVVGGSSSSVGCHLNSATSATNGVSPSSSNSSLASLGSGCQVCKRQKMQHNFGNNEHKNGSAMLPMMNADDNKVGSAIDHRENGVATANEAVESNEQDERDGGKVFSNRRNNPFETSKPEVMEEECFVSSTKLTPHFDRCALSSSARSSCSNSTMKQLPLTKKMQPPLLKLKSIEQQLDKQQQQQQPQDHCCKRSCTPPGTFPALNIDCEFKTPNATTIPTATTMGNNQSTKYHHKATPKPNLLQVANVYTEQPQPQQRQHQHQHQPHYQYNQKQQQQQQYLTVVPCCGSSDCTNATTKERVMQQQQQQPTYSQSMLMRKNLPKVNLTPIFCNPTSSTSSSSTTNGNHCNGIGTGNCVNMHTHISPMSTSGSSVAAIANSRDSAFPFDVVTINRVKYERAAAAAAAAAHLCTANNNNNHKTNNNNNNNFNTNTATTTATVTAKATATIFDNNVAVPVQKSYSAPTLPNSPSLSPRFAKQAAIYKRRSRHLSDRSDRSSLGSDEQYSDEDLECGMGGSSSNLMNGVAISPMKQRARIAAMFSRQPMLGNLEECLMQKRLTPKTEVNGFKVLLGASGSFCPPQLTIPAAAYFYELRGETLSTPYLCEIRLPRKGYSVPHTGTVQATLLNPLGTVVRMFVIPYDMRDMPPRHQTFIRQRILADASASSEPPQNGASTSGVQNETDLPEMETIYDVESGDGDSVAGTGSGDGDGTGVGVVVSGVGQRNAPAINRNERTEDRSLGHFISADHMKRLRYSIHLRFQTSSSGRLMLHTDVRLLISRRTDCDTAAAHAKGLLEAPNELIIDTVMPSNPKYSVRHDVANSGASSTRI